MSLEVSSIWPVYVNCMRKDETLSLFWFGRTEKSRDWKTPRECDIDEWVLALDAALMSQAGRQWLIEHRRDSHKFEIYRSQYGKLAWTAHQEREREEIACTNFLVISRPLLLTLRELPLSTHSSTCDVCRTISCIVYFATSPRANWSSGRTTVWLGNKVWTDWVNIELFSKANVAEYGEIFLHTYL